MGFGTIAQYLMPEWSLLAWITIIWIILLGLDQIILVGRVSNVIALLFKMNDLQFKVVTTGTLLLLTFGWNAIKVFLGSTGGSILFWTSIIVIIFGVLLFWRKK